jgi:hypothetical protein
MIHALAGEQLRSFAAAARELPSRTGGHAHATTLWRWATAGAKSPLGVRVRLERVRIGGTWYTSLESLQRFFAALTATPYAYFPPPRTPGLGRRAAERAGAVLDKLGIREHHTPTPALVCG